METGADILFFWVSKMIMLGLYTTGKVPFKTVYLHGMVRDKNNQKMSKSKGNVISPIEMTDKYGTDALRMALIIGNTPGTDMALSEDKIRGYKNFANKLWNISRFVLSNCEGLKYDENFSSFEESDKELREKWNEFIKDIRKDIDEYRLYMAGEKLYHFAWNNFADIILEDSKKVLSEGSEAEKESRKQTLVYILENLIRALHPFMPFATEAIWQLWPFEKPQEFLLVMPYPIVK